MATVREPRPEDADQLGVIHVAAWQAAYRSGLMPDEYLDSLDPADRAAMWAEGLSRPPRERRHRLVADVDGRPVGFILCGPIEGDEHAEEGQVYAINVHPDHWGEGHGGALLSAGMDALRAEGFGRAVLWVHPGNARARSFYESWGWVDDGAERQEEVLGITVPEVRYRVELGGASSG